MSSDKEAESMEFPAHYTVTHSCGHDQVHDLSDKPEGGRSRVAAWLQSRKCTDCKAADRMDPRTQWRTRQREQLLAQIGEWEARAGMPELDGTVKSVPWAREVRFKLLSIAYDHFSEEGIDETDFIVRVELPATEVTSATWWIEHRDTGAGDVESLLAHELSQSDSKPRD